MFCIVDDAVLLVVGGYGEERCGYRIVVDGVGIVFIFILLRYLASALDTAAVRVRYFPQRYCAVGVQNVQGHSITGQFEGGGITLCQKLDW